MRLRSLQTITSILMAVLIGMCLAGCMQPSSTSSSLKSKMRAIWYRDQKAHINAVQASLLSQTNSIPDHPRGAAETLRALDAYADAYTKVDVSACPEDFRKQFYIAREAWVESATDLQNEDLYSRQHSSYSDIQGVATDFEMRDLERRTNASMENAVAQVEELRAIAQRYGAEWH